MRNGEVGVFQGIIADRDILTSKHTEGARYGRTNRALELYHSSVIYEMATERVQQFAQKCSVQTIGNIKPLAKQDTSKTN